MVSAFALAIAASFRLTTKLCARSPDPELRAKMEAELNRRLPELHFNAAQAVEVFQVIQRETPMQIIVHWMPEGSSFGRSHDMVNARIRDIKLGKAVDVLVRQLRSQPDRDGPEPRIIRDFERGELRIYFDRADVPRKQRAYDVRDLLMVPRDTKLSFSILRDELVKYVIDNVHPFDLRSIRIEGGTIAGCMDDEEDGHVRNLLLELRKSEGDVALRLLVNR
jgi:hypothetical protein